jgi:nucleotide-binding universal stress UspA family protein
MRKVNCFQLHVNYIYCTKHFIMDKILAPTDFSTNSKRGMRFAMQWATQQELEIVYLHVYHPASYPNWSEKEFELNARRQVAKLSIKLKKFVENLYKTTNVKPGKYDCVVIRGVLSADMDIMDYCRQAGDIQYICMSTRGAGRRDRFFGTHTGTLITSSEVPVIAVPKNYRKTALNAMLYASDFKNYSQELKKVVAFARPLHAKINLFHLNSGKEKRLGNSRVEKEIKNEFGNDIKLFIRDKDAHHTLRDILQNERFTPKPSLIIMFTNQKRNILEKLISRSKTEKLSFNTRIPLLAFHKD